MGHAFCRHFQLLYLVTGNGDADVGDLRAGALPAGLAHVHVEAQGDLVVEGTVPGLER